LEQFYDDLDRAHKMCKSQAATIIQLDLNAKVGDERIGNTVGTHGLGRKK